jgi:hypothetical protein
VQTCQAANGKQGMTVYAQLASTRCVTAVRPHRSTPHWGLPATVHHTAPIHLLHHQSTSACGNPDTGNAGGTSTAAYAASVASVWSFQHNVWSQHAVALLWVWHPVTLGGRSIASCCTRSPRWSLTTALRATCVGWGVCVYLAPLLTSRCGAGVAWGLCQASAML